MANLYRRKSDDPMGFVNYTVFDGKMDVKFLEILGGRRQKSVSPNLTSRVKMEGGRSGVLRPWHGPDSLDRGQNDIRLPPCPVGQTTN
jgi:hypothetical protein